MSTAIYGLAIPSQMEPFAKAWANEAHFIEEMIANDWTYAPVTKSEIIGQFLDEQEAREDVPEAFMLFDQGASEIIEYGNGCLEVNYATATEAPTRFEFACEIWGHDRYLSKVFRSPAAAEAFLATYRGHQWIAAARVLRQCLEH